MTHRFSFNLSSSWIDDSDLLVLARRDELGSVPIEARAEDDVGMTVHVNEHLTSADIPDDDLVVGAGCQQHIESRRMPQHKTNATLVIEQVDDRLGECSREAAIGNLPHLKANKSR